MQAEDDVIQDKLEALQINNNLEVPDDRRDSGSLFVDFRNESKADKPTDASCAYSSADKLKSTEIELAERE